jgi:hypothetical protein
LVHQFLNFINETSRCPVEPAAKVAPSGREACIARAFQQYSICEIIVSIFVRSLLYFEYEIAEALDYNQSISDHTVYSALCDAFQYNSLKMEENYAEISGGSFIRVIRMKGITNSFEHHQAGRNGSNYYLVSIPLARPQTLPLREPHDSDSFRIRRKSSDSSNETASFKQLHKKSSSARADQLNKKF